MSERKSGERRGGNEPVVFACLHTWAWSWMPDGIIYRGAEMGQKR